MLSGLLSYVKKSRYHIGLLFFVVLLLFSAHYFGEAVRDVLAFHRGDVEGGELWRIYTSQWVHFTSQHLWMNVGATVAVIYVLFFTLPLRLSIVAISVLPLMVGISVWVFSSDVAHYRGFSAVIHGLISMGLLANLKQEPKLMTLGLVGITAKIVYEHSPYFDVMHMQEDIGSAVAIDAHLYGYVAGLVLAGVFWLIYRLSGRRQGMSGKK